MLVHHGKDPDPPGSAQVSQKTFLHALSSSIYKTCLFLLWFLGYGYSRHQTVAPHIADLFICTFLEIQQGDHLVSVDRIGILVALPSMSKIFGLFVHSPAPPLSSSFRSYLWGSLYLWHGYNLSNTQPVSPPSLPVKIIYKNGERTQLQLIYWQDLPSQNVNVSRAVNIFEW